VNLWRVLKHFARIGFILILGIAMTACQDARARGDAVWAALVGSNRHQAEVAGLSLHYIDLGPGVGEPVVMVHGFGDSTYAWHRNAAALRDGGLRVILVDQPGLGRSATPPDTHVYSIENQAGAILKLVTRLGIERFKLVGHSMGGGIALYLGLNHPDRVSQVAAIDPAAFYPGCAFRYPGVEFVARALGARRFVTTALRDVYYQRDQVTETMIDEYAQQFEDSSRMSVLTSLCRQYFSSVEYTRMTESYANFRPPLLIVWGERDTWIPLTFGERLNRLVPGSMLRVIADAGHAPHQEQSQLVNPILTAFLHTDAQR